jgi:predicted phosphodiesterase
MINKRRSGTIKLLATVILLGIIIFVCIKRWNAWFDNPVEPPYASSNMPVRIQLTFGNDGQFSRNVSWQCGDTLADSQLFFVKSTTTDTTAVAAEGKIFRTQGGTTVSYHAKLTHLAEGEYAYSVCTNGKQSAWYRFTVSAGNDFSFVYIGDIQDSIGGTAKKGFDLISRNEKDAAFWILGGDVVERPQDRYWNEYYTSIDSIVRTTPVIACPGNHEYHKGISGKLEERFVYNFSYLVDSRSDGNAVFTTRYGNTAIITLDSNRDTWTLFSQRRWLKQALQKAQDARWKIVVLHHPIYSVRGKLRHFFIRHAFNSLIREYGVDLVLQGHEHCYARMITKDENNKLTTPVYLISQFSPKDYPVNLDKKYDRFGNEMRFYQIVDVTPDTLSLKSYTENGDLYDQIHIVKTGGKLQVSDLATGIPEHFNPHSPRMQNN